MAKRSKPPAVVHPALPQIAIDLTKTDISNPLGVAPVYSNNAAMFVTPHDIRILFSEIAISSVNQTVPEVDLRASVVMAPTQFKAFASAISQTLGNYEKQFGEINWPPKNQ